ncbi:hypothetical protein AVEN_236141-1 [Araneus ventricosus]|uniref:Uncharacterized protein n=1 Tax=Araneus ventricosus TaxID=182803 RepID=A0A4Y2HU89_ARAVE|nr:hypothetical protein AVEN_236141-1 [Araneus ventricosus]
MAKGSYNISVSGDSNVEEEGKNNNENQDCMNSCLGPAFLRSLSFHDRPRSSRVPTKKELRKRRFKAWVSSSLEKIPSNPSPSSEARPERNANRGFESVGVSAETEMTTQPSIYNASSSAIWSYQQTGQNQLSEPDSWLEDRYTKFSVESEKLLEKTVAILRTVDEDISESLTNLTKPESIALESVMEIYRNKGRYTTGCSAGAEFDLSTESSSEPIYENWQPFIQQIPKDVQAHSTPRSPKNTQAHSPRQSPKIVQVQSSQQSPKNAKTRSAQQSPKNLQDQSSQRSPKNLQDQSSQRSPMNLQDQSSQRSPMNLQDQSSQRSPMNLQDQSSQRSPMNLQAQSSQRSPMNLQAQSSQQSPENLLVHSAQETLKNFESLSSSNSENMQSLTKPDSDDVRSVEQSPRNLLSSPKISAPDDTTKVKSVIEFDLPSDHEQFIKIIGALQSRSLEYREMTKDIAVSALEECLNFSEPSISRMLNLRMQFESQKRNFRDFKELCCRSVVFGPDSLPINEKVTEVIQSFYLKLLQEENETFMVRLEFGLKMGEVYTKMLELETESKKIITTLEKEILYFKKTSVGFKV